MFKFIKSLLTKDKSKDEIVKSTFNGIDITDIIKTNDILEKIMTLKSNNISEDNTNKILYDLNNSEGRVILIDINSQFSTILDYECFKGFNFSLYI